MRVVASSKGGIQEKENRKGIGREKGNERNLGMDENRIEGNIEIELHRKKNMRRKRGKNTLKKRQDATHKKENEVILCKYVKIGRIKL